MNNYCMTGTVVGTVFINKIVNKRPTSVSSKYCLKVRDKRLHTKMTIWYITFSSLIIICISLQFKYHLNVINMYFKTATVVVIRAVWCLNIAEHILDFKKKKRKTKSWWPKSQFRIIQKKYFICHGSCTILLHHHTSEQT